MVNSMPLDIECVIATDYKGDPKIKITADCAQVTLDVYTIDYNMLRGLIGKTLELKVK